MIDGERIKTPTKAPFGAVLDERGVPDRGIYAHLCRFSERTFE